MRRKVVATVGAVALALAALPASVAAEPDLESQDKTQLELTKLRAEIRKLQDETSGTADFARIAPFVTALVAVIGAFATLAKQNLDANRQKKLDREERERARIQRFDEQFSKMVDNLGSSTDATRAAAAALIPTFLRPEYSQFHEQVFALLLATLRFPRGDVGDRILARAFERVAPEQILSLRVADPTLQLDLSRCYLARIDLSGVDLSRADLGFADLHGSTLQGCDLRGVAGFKVNLDGAVLTNAVLDEARLHEATLKRAQLQGARLVSAKLKNVNASAGLFQRAKLQEAHFEGALLLGARFEDADLNNAYFAGAQLDDVARQSIARGAQNWRKANFDDDVREDLERRSAPEK